MGRSIVIVTQITIDATPPEVWPYLVDWENLDRWMLEASKVRVIGRQRQGVGVEAQAKIKIAGLTTLDRIRVIQWEPPRLLEIQHLGWVKGSGRLECRSDDGATHLDWRERLIPPMGPLGYLGMLVLKSRMARTFRRDAEMLKGIVEAGPRR